ncbi:MAG: ATP-binding protein [Candidatus Omnitrophica bacterium]|nr:ATP-binding protein [Candidatus Omnitrophota bacterium]
MKLKLTNSIITLVGKKGTGKTTHVKEILIKGKYEQIFVLDYLYEFRNYATISQVSHDGANIKRFCRDIVWENCDTRIKSVVIFDEIHLYGKNNFDIDFLYRCGRHANLDIIATAQRFKDVHPLVRSQSNEFHVFQITEPLDLLYLKDYVGNSIVNTVKNLRVLQYVILTI